MAKDKKMADFVFGRPVNRSETERLFMEGKFVYVCVRGW